MFWYKTLWRFCCFCVASFYVDFARRRQHANDSSKVSHNLIRPLLAGLYNCTLLLLLCSAPKYDRWEPHCHLLPYSNFVLECVWLGVAFGNCVSVLMIIILVQSYACWHRCRCIEMSFKQKHVKVHCVIVVFKHLLLHLLALSISASSAYISKNAMHCDTDNCIVLLCLHWPSFICYPCISCFCYWLREGWWLRYCCSCLSLFFDARHCSCFCRRCCCLVCYLPFLCLLCWPRQRHCPCRPSCPYYSCYPYYPCCFKCHY